MSSICTSRANICGWSVVQVSRLVETNSPCPRETWTPTRRRGHRKRMDSQDIFVGVHGVHVSTAFSKLSIKNAHTFSLPLFCVSFSLWTFIEISMDLVDTGDKSCVLKELRCPWPCSETWTPAWTRGHRLLSIVLTKKYGVNGYRSRRG